MEGLCWIDYSGGLSVFTAVLIRGRKDYQNQRKRCDDRIRGHGQRQS